MVHRTILHPWFQTNDLAACLLPGTRLPSQLYQRPEPPTWWEDVTPAQVVLQPHRRVSYGNGLGGRLDRKSVV